MSKWNRQETFPTLKLSNRNFINLQNIHNYKKNKKKNSNIFVGV